MPGESKEKYVHPPARGRLPRHHEQAPREVLETYRGDLLRTLPRGDVDFAAMRHIRQGRHENYSFGIWRISTENPEAGKFIPLPGIPVEFAQSFVKLVSGVARPA